MFHKHSFHLDKQDYHGEYIVFKFICNGCGHPLTKVVSTDKAFEFEVE